MSLRTTLFALVLALCVFSALAISHDHIRQLRQKFRSSSWSQLDNAAEILADLENTVAGDSEADTETEAEVNVDVSAEAMAEAVARMEALQQVSHTVHFETIEHKRIGDAVATPVVSALDQVSMQKATYENNYKNTLSYGDAIAMSGDFYGVPAKLTVGYEELRGQQAVICWGKTPRDRRVNFLKAFESLYNGQTYAERLKTNDAAGDGWDVVKSYMQKEGEYLDYMNGHALNLPDKSASQIQAIKAKLDAINNAAATSLAAERKASLRLNEVDEVKNTADLLNKFGYAMRLLNVNVDHFNGDECAMNSYIAGHQMAMRYAAKAGASPDIVMQKKYMNIAVLMNGYADHFLTDSFCAGHFRGHRSHLLKRCEKANLSFATKLFSPLLSAGLAANLAHDMDNFNGVEVVSLNDVAYVKSLSLKSERDTAVAFYNQKYTIYGDFRLFDGPSMAQAGNVLTAPLDPRAAPFGFTNRKVTQQVQFERLKAAVEASVGDLKWAFDQAVAARKAKKSTDDVVNFAFAAKASAVFHAPDMQASVNNIPFYYARNPCPLYSMKDQHGLEMTGFTALSDPTKVQKLIDRNHLVFWTNDMSLQCKQIAYQPETWAKLDDATWNKCKSESSYTARCWYRDFVDTDCPADRYEPDFAHPVTVTIPSPKQGAQPLSVRRLVNFIPPTSSSLSFSSMINGLIGQIKVGLKTEPGYAVQVKDATFTDA